VFEKIDEHGLDILREMCNIGAGHAATALSQMTGRRISLEVPRVRLEPIKGVPELIGGAEQLVAGLYLRILGQTQGTLFMIFPSESAVALLGLLGVPVREPFETVFDDEMTVSSLKEVGNILASSYLTAINRLTGLVLLPSVPSFAYDMAGSIVDAVLIEVGKVSDAALVVETVFKGTDNRIIGHVFLIPDPNSLAVILKAVS
jgi:chemotaxis protein CheC